MCLTEAQIKTCVLLGRVGESPKVVRHIGGMLKIIFKILSKMSLPRFQAFACQGFYLLNIIQIIWIKKLWLSISVLPLPISEEK